MSTTTEEKPEKKNRKFSKTGYLINVNCSDWRMEAYRWLGRNREPIAPLVDELLQLYFAEELKMLKDVRADDERKEKLRAMRIKKTIERKREKDRRQQDIFEKQA